jgi:hypothetical protein
MKNSRIFLLCAVFTFVIACTADRPVPALDLAATPPDVAAQFQTETEAHDGKSQTAQWRFWREGQTLVTESLADRTGERWQRDGNTLFYTKLYHDDQKGIALRADDLGVRDSAPAWAQQSLLVNPGVLQALKAGESGWRHDYPYRRYTGDVDGVEWDITMRVDLMLPLQVVRVEKGDRHVTRLIEVHPLPQSPWQPTASQTYELIDYADIGDRASDPFIRKVESQLGGLNHSH